MKNVAIYSSEEILKEYQKILTRDFDFSEEKVLAMTEKVLSFVMLVIPKTKVDVVREDPSDNKIIECAIESNSAYIITYNKHLLNIKEYNSIKIVKPEEVIRLY